MDGAKMRENFRKKLPSSATNLINRFRLNPPQSIRKLAEQIGIGVVEIQMGRGEYGYLDERPELGFPTGYVIYINQSLSNEEKRWTLAHELGHYFLHRDRRAGTFDPEVHRTASGWYADGTEEFEAENFAEDLFFGGGALEAFTSLHGCDAAKLAQQVFGVPVSRVSRAIEFYRKYKGLEVKPWSASRNRER
jgi:Zn-dependent peptidase ImmA (M78 family)